jgi:hypothetical protein
MQIILSNRGHEIQVDDWNYAWLSQWRWYVSNGYATRWEGRNQGVAVSSRITILMARLVLGNFLGRALLPKPQEIAEHQDRNTLNNQEHNLRLASYGTNGMNRAKQRGINTSQYKGVCCCFEKYPSKPWIGSISLGDGTRKEQYFATELEAALWYDQMARQHHGEFARTNFQQVLFVGANYNAVRVKI